MSASFASLQALAEIAPLYRHLRAQHPRVRAITVHQYLRNGEGEPFEQFICRHDWVISEETDRCYCSYCGADGDA
jgi:hypothetical protein